MAPDSESCDYCKHPIIPGDEVTQVDVGDDYSELWHSECADEVFGVSDDTPFHEIARATRRFVTPRTVAAFVSGFILATLLASMFAY